MWKTHFIVVKTQLARPQGMWKRLWKTFLPVEKKTKEILSHLFHSFELSTACGNVENFY
jgi:hypothetical protein